MMFYVVILWKQCLVSRRI